MLLHGAWHTGRVWDPVAAELTARGFGVIAPDLPIDDVRACAAEHVDAIVAACDGVEGELVAVGHTSAGLILPLVAGRLPVARFVYVNALLPLPGASFAEQLSTTDYEHREDLGRRYDREARSYWADKDGFRVRLAADLPETELDRVWSQMRRQARCPLREVTPLKTWPDVPSAALVYSGDADLPVPWLKRCAEERLGVRPAELPGSQLGFLADPERFVDTLLGLSD